MSNTSFLQSEIQQALLNVIMVNVILHLLLAELQRPVGVVPSQITENPVWKLLVMVWPKVITLSGVYFANNQFIQSFKLILSLVVCLRHFFYYNRFAIFYDLLNYFFNNSTLLHFENRQTVKKWEKTLKNELKRILKRLKMFEN